MSTGIVYVCDECGSANVETYAMVAWNIANQDWEIREVKTIGQIAGYPDDYCHDCAKDSYSETSLATRNASLKEIAVSVLQREGANG